MRVLVFSQYWAPEDGVPQRRWSWLTSLLIEAGHEVTVVCPPPHYSRKVSVREWWSKGGLIGERNTELGSQGETIVRSGFFPSGNSLIRRILNQATVASSMLLLQLFPDRRNKGYHPDLVIGTVPALPISVVTAVAAKRYGAPYVIDLRDAWPELLYQHRDWNKGVGETSLPEKILTNGPLQLLSRVTELALNRVLVNADGIVTTSSRLEDFLKVKLPRLGARDCQQITTVRNVFPTQARLERKRKWNSDNSLHVIYAGTIGRAQKLENTLKAAKIVQDRGGSIQLKFIGEGAAWNAVKELNRKLDLDAEIIHRIPPTELRDAYEWADTALVHLTDWEPLNATVPSKAYELMTLGLHITAVVQGETADLIRRFDAGDVVEPENPEALAEMWLDLLEDRNRLQVPMTGSEWVEYQRAVIAPKRFLTLVNSLAPRMRK